MNASNQMAEQVDNTNVLEVGSMEFECNTFLEKKAKMYVEQQGLDTALYKLGILASRKPKARQIFDIVQHWKDISEANIIEEQTAKKVENTPSAVPATKMNLHRAQRKEWEPKELFDLKVSMMGIGFDEVDIDENWNPIINVNFHGKTKINGKKIWLTSDAMKYISDLNQNDIDAKVTVFKVKEDRIIGKPDMESFFAEKERRRTIKEEFFKVTISNKRFVYTEETNKRIWVVEDGFKALREQPGRWLMKVVDETTGEIKCEPVKWLKEETFLERKVVSGRVVLEGNEKKLYIPGRNVKDGWWRLRIVGEDDRNVYVEQVSPIKRDEFIMLKMKKAIPEDYQGKQVWIPREVKRGQFFKDGVWKFKILNERQNTIYAEPVECIESVGDRIQKARALPKTGRNTPQRKRYPVRKTQHREKSYYKELNSVDKRLNQLKLNGRVEF